MDQYSGSEADKYRSFISGEGEKNTVWRFGGPPNYDAVNKLFEQGRTKIWPAGSLEEKVQNLVKTWEMEMVHKVSPDDFKTVDTRKLTISVNGRAPLTREGVAKIGGGYNMFLQTSLPSQFRLYDPDKETFASALEAFTTTFPRGFAVEVLQVYSGPPVIAYKFRHWGYMEGPFKGHPPSGELVQFYGISIIELNEEMKMVKLEFFYDRSELLAGLMKGVPSGASSDPMPSSCPLLNTIAE